MSVAQLTQSAADRPLGLRMRGDLEFRPQRFGRQRYWAVKDPVSLKYFHLREEEYVLLKMLDGRTSLEDLRRRLNQAIAPRRLSIEQVQGFLATLHRYGLVLAASPGQGEQLLLRQGETRRRQRFAALAGVLAIRFRGVNPRPLLDWLYPKCRFVFSPLFVGCALALAVAALVLVVVEFDTVAARLPDLRAIVGASNLPWLIVVLAATKILHELGHALACRHFGGDCHEIGVMLLVFTPCLYCNVSDSWMLENKWRRIAIAAAGIYVELILASICAFLWWFSQPGLFNSLALNVVLICSLGTLLFNGNPLLRYDGYFILSDLIEVPNLKPQSTAVVRRILARWCLGMELAEDRSLPPGRQGLLVLYAVASTVYRLVIVILVLWVLSKIARPYHLEVLVVPVAAVTFIGMIWPALEGTIRWARDPTRRRRIAPARAAMTLVVLAAAVLAVVLVPLPMRVSAPVVLEYRDARHVYVTEPGTLLRVVRAGQTVREGEVLAQLSNPEIQLEVAKLTQERDTQRLYLANLEARRLQGGIDGAKIPAAQAALADAQTRLEQLQRDAARLTITAPVSGTVLPPPELPAESSDSAKLGRWSGTPLEQRNLGSFLETGTLVCLVGDERHFEAILHIDESDVELVRDGQGVRIRLDHMPGETYTGRIVEIAKLDLKVMPRGLAAAGDLPSRTDERGLAHPLDTWYQARVELAGDPPHLLARVHGRAKIAVAPQTLGARIARYLRQTFSR
jgi:putative peptide zinc metalloprotease protein